MHFVIMIFGILAGLGFWIYRIRAASVAAKTAYDAVTSAKGVLTRKHRAAQSDFSPVAAIDRPAVAAAALLRLEGSEDDWAFIKPHLQDLLTAEVGDEQAHEAIVYAEWLPSQHVPIRKSISYLEDQLTDWLAPAELEKFTALRK